MASRQHTKYAFALSYVALIIYTAGYFAPTWLSVEFQDKTLSRGAIVCGDAECSDWHQAAAGYLTFAYILMAVSCGAIACFLICECGGYIIYAIGVGLLLSGVVAGIGCAFVGSKKHDIESFGWGYYCASISAGMFACIGIFVIANGWSTTPRIVREY